MKKDAEIKLLNRERKKGLTQKLAAAKAGMSARTARKYERGGFLPSEMPRPPKLRTRPDPFADVWSGIAELLAGDDALQAKTLFDLLVERHPGRFEPGQVRTLQRRVEHWRATEGPGRLVMFEQIHQPGNLAQSDFTDMGELAITIAGELFVHKVFHMVLTFSNVEAVNVCFSESFEALSDGIQAAFWQFGGVPAIHRTDNLSAAVHRLERDGRKGYTGSYQALMNHYGCIPDSNYPGEAHQNGDVESSNGKLKSALDQTLRLRGSRDFETRAAYEAWLLDQVRRRNDTRQTRFAVEREALNALPTASLAQPKIVTVTVTRFSTLLVLGNTYSVPSRLIGSRLQVRLRAETLDVYRGSQQVAFIPRLIGRGGHRIDYRHVIWSLVRKPRAFAAWRFREELFPLLVFRRAYDALVEARTPSSADQEYLRILLLAASGSEADVAIALEIMLEQKVPIGSSAVRDLVREPGMPAVPHVTTPIVDLTVYDRLLAPRCAN
ncbi:MAG: transposase [Cyanobacteria bacterium RYN_339]|nr:transposase [Cyanobacteria bacterium RYN_339]